MIRRVRGAFEVGNPRQVGLLSGAHAVNEFYSLALPPILPLLVSDLSLSYASAGLVVTVYFGMYTLFQLPAGVLADRVGARWIVSAGMVVLSAGMLVSSVAPGYFALLGGQAIAGIGGSTYHPAGMSLISDIESGDTEGRAMGVHGFAGVAGNMLAPVVVGGVAAALDWRAALAASSVVGIAYAVAFAALVESPDGQPDREARGPLRDRLRGALAGAFGVPLTWWVGGLVLAKVLFSLQVNGVRTFTTSYVFARAAGSTSAANAVFFAYLAGSAIASIWFGALADRFDRVRLLTATFLAGGVVIAATALVPPSIPAYTVWFFAVGIVIYGALPVINSLTSGIAKREFSGGLFGVTQTASGLGSAVSPVAFGALATYVSIDVALPATAGVGLAAGVVFLAVGGRLAAVAR